MKSVVLVCGHGPGISASVARRFGKAGHSVALVARNQARLTAAAADLGKEGIDAKGFACDLGKPEDVKQLVATVKAELGPIAVIHWNAYQSIQADILDLGADALRTMFDVQVTGLSSIRT